MTSTTIPNASISDVYSDCYVYHCLYHNSSTPLDEEQGVLVTQAKVATEFMSVTIFQAMDFARMAADGTMKTLVPRKTPTNLKVLVDKCAAVLDGYPKQVPITFAVGSDIATEVLVDGDWIWQMLINLLSK
jgi:signal transduction histidine kinase